MIALLREAEATADGILEQNRGGLDRLIAQLEAEEILDAEQIAACLSGGDKVRYLKPQPTDGPLE